MSRPSSSGSGKSSSPQPAGIVTPPITDTASSPAAPPLKPLYRVETQSRGQRRAFLDHLIDWSLDHDASLHFHGKISVLPPDTGKVEDLELGKPVACVLTDTLYPDARQVILIKLFPPQIAAHTLQRVGMKDPQKGSMKLYECFAQSTSQNVNNTQEQHVAASVKGRYKLVVRCGSGWMSSRDYFNKIYFSHLCTESSARLNMESLLHKRSQSLGPPPQEKDTVTIRPLFHPFGRLPVELQELVLTTSAGLTRHFDLCSDDYGLAITKKKRARPAISLSTMLRIAKPITVHLLPYVYRATDFHCGLTGFTNFLWQAGPSNRREVRLLTFHFGRLALLHCVRWMAPDAVFELFEPPVATRPRSLQYFWRCQIQELVKELDLSALTIDVKYIPREDLPMIVKVMKGAFEGVERLRFVDGSSERVMIDDERLKGLEGQQTWRQMCIGYYRRHRLISHYFKSELLIGDEQGLEDMMDKDQEFFDKVSELVV